MVAVSSVLVLAVAIVAVLAYELHDEIYDDDLRDSLVDSPLVVAVLLIGALAVVVLMIAPEVLVAPLNTLRTGASETVDALVGGVV